MNHSREAAMQFNLTGQMPFAGRAAPVIELTQKNACAIVSRSFRASDSAGGKPETCVSNFVSAGNLPAHPHANAIQFP